MSSSNRRDNRSVRLREKVLASAFPDLVEPVVDERPQQPLRWQDLDDDDELSAISHRIEEDNHISDDDEDEDVNIDSAGEKIRTVFHTSKGTSQAGMLLEPNNVNTKKDTNEFLIHLADHPTNSPTTVTTAHSEWYTPNHRGRRAPQNQQAKNGKKLIATPTMWEILCCTGIVLLIAACISILALVVIKKHVDTAKTGSSPLQSDVMDYNAKAQTTSMQEVQQRLQEFQQWLELDSTPALGTPQYKALHWMAADDLQINIYEQNPLPTKLIYDVYKQVVESGVATDKFKKDYSEMNILFLHINQRFALLVLYFANISEVNGEGWASLTGIRMHECDWLGVICDSLTKAVTSIEISGSDAMLSGSLATEIGLLSSLGAYTCVRKLSGNYRRLLTPACF
jgi:hypothetical protein